MPRREISHHSSLPVGAIKVAALLLFWGAIHARAVGQAVPDFSLNDVNVYSASNGTSISPRDYLQQTSGWYFSHST